MPNLCGNGSQSSMPHQTARLRMSQAQDILGMLIQAILLALIRLLRYSQTVPVMQLEVLACQYPSDTTARHNTQPMLRSCLCTASWLGKSVTYFWKHCAQAVLMQTYLQLQLQAQKLSRLALIPCISFVSDAPFYALCLMVRLWQEASHWAFCLLQLEVYWTWHV